MVYINDLEGKITKINLTSSTKNGAELFDKLINKLGEQILEMQDYSVF